MQERGQSVSSGMWVALGGALIAIAAVVVLATTPAQPRAHAGVRHFSLAAVTRPSATRRVLELSGRGDFPPGVTRAGNRLLVKGSRADDTLIVDFSHGNPIPSGGLLYDGTGHETAVGNVLVIRGGHFRRDVYDFTSASAGSIQLDRTRIAYRNLQPVANTGTATDAVFNLPAGANSALLQDDGTPGNNKSELFSGAHTFETTTFTNPSSSLTINGGGDGDALTVEPADSFTAANVTVGSEGSVAADSLTTTGTLRITAGSVTQPSGALAVGAVGVNTVGGIALSGASNAIGLFAGSASGAGAAVSVVSSPLSVGTVAASGSFAGASGVSTNDGDIGLSTTTGSLKLSQALTAGTAKLTATCGTGGGACAVDASGGSLNGSPVTLSSGSGPGTFDLTDDNTVGAGPLIIDGGGTGTAKLGRSSVSQSPDSGLVLRNLVSAAVTGGNFTANAKEGILVQNTAAANIGGAATGQPNVIAGNGTNGITVASGSGIQIVQNSIFANRGLGISLQNGANHGLSAPVLSAAAPSGSGTHVTGSLHGTTGHSYRIELFDNSACDPSGFTEGRTFIGSTTVAADPSGDAAFNSVVPGPSGVNDGVGATATDVATGDTSQFSSCIKPAPPSVSILAPIQGAKYKLRAVARASFSCADDSRGPGIALCLPTGINGALVDTRTAGSHTFAVTAVSSDGMSSTQSVTYTVQSPPSNRFTLSQKKLKQTTGDVSFAVAVPGAGTVSVVETMLSSGKQFVAGRARLSPRRRQTVRVAIKPNGRALRLVRHHKALVSVQLQVTFTPNGGTSHSVRFALSLSNRA